MKNQLVSPQYCKFKSRLLGHFGAFVLFLLFANCAIAQSLDRIEVSTIDQFQKAAPGESLPISLKLYNMGGSGRVDVIITYRLENKQQTIFSEETDTVAVETTASFIKQVKIPSNLIPGQYFIEASMKYPDQKTPAISRLPFQIEYKYFGFFINQLLILIGVIIVGCILSLSVFWLINKRRKIVVSQFEYKNIDKKLKPFYQLISDIILNMRQHLGDKAIILANQIAGLKVAESGEVLLIEKEPMEIVTLLSLAYEKSLNYQGLRISEQVLDNRTKQSLNFEDQVAYQKTSRLLDNIKQFFIQK
jgi:hypothetical protein